MDIASLKTREEIPALLAERGYTGWGVEIGGHLGHYSDSILSGSNLSKLFSVDTWHESFPGLPDGMSGLEAFQKCAVMLWRHRHRSVMVRQTSVEAADIFADESMDFIYIDGNHTYEAVTSDIEVWWPKMKGGGIFSGHDYNDISPEVRQAVDEFVIEMGLTLHLTECDFLHGPEKHVIRSWLVEVPHG